jgi:hypothetical protein
MMGVYCGRFDPQVGVTLIGYDEPTRSDEDLWAADLTSPTNSVIECLLLEQSPIVCNWPVCDRRVRRS